MRRELLAEQKSIDLLERSSDLKKQTEAHLAGIESTYLQVVLQYAKIHGAKVVANYIANWQQLNGAASVWRNLSGQLEIRLEYPLLRTLTDLGIFLHELGHLFDDQMFIFVPVSSSLETKKIDDWGLLVEFTGKQGRGEPREILCQEIAATRYAYQQLVKLGIDLTEPMGYLERAYGTYVKRWGPSVRYAGQQVPPFHYVYQSLALEREELYVWQDDATDGASWFRKGDASRPSGSQRSHPRFGRELASPGSDAGN